LNSPLDGLSPTQPALPAARRFRSKTPAPRREHRAFQLFTQTRQLYQIYLHLLQLLFNVSILDLRFQTFSVHFVKIQIIIQAVLQRLLLLLSVVGLLANIPAHSMPLILRHFQIIY